MENEEASSQDSSWASTRTLHRIGLPLQPLRCCFAAAYCTNKSILLTIARINDRHLSIPQLSPMRPETTNQLSFCITTTMNIHVFLMTNHKMCRSCGPSICRRNWMRTGWTIIQACRPCQYDLAIDSDGREIERPPAYE